MDFANATLPEFRPLARSFVVDEAEDELRRLFLRLFSVKLGEQAFDANVLGAAHLGSLALIQKSLTAEGLAMMPGGISTEMEQAARYLYRAWKGNNGQGRGMHFLRTYLQLLYPNVCDVRQLWHLAHDPYPNGTVSENLTLYPGFMPRIGISQGLKLDGSWAVGRKINPTADEIAHPERYFERVGAYLTSRVRISLEFGVQSASISQLLGVFRATIPARLVPEIRFYLREIIPVPITTAALLRMRKTSVVRYPWRALKVSDRPEIRWTLGRNGSSNAPKLRATISARKVLRKTLVAARMFRLNGRPLDGSWEIGAIGDTSLAPSIGLTVRTF